MDGEAFASSLLEIAHELQGLTELPRKTAELAAPKIADVIADELRTGVGPRGEPWPALKDGSGRIPFSSSGRMAAQISVVPSGPRVVGKLNAPWNIHQYGSRNPKKGVPARPAFQKGELSPSWSAAMDEAANEALKAMTPKLTAAGG